MPIEDLLRSMHQERDSSPEMEAKAAEFVPPNPDTPDWWWRTQVAKDWLQKEREAFWATGAVGSRTTFNEVSGVSHRTQTLFFPDGTEKTEVARKKPGSWKWEVISPKPPNLLTARLKAAFDITNGTKILTGIKSLTRPFSYLPTLLSPRKST